MSEPTAEIALTSDDEARIATLLSRLPIASRPSLLRHALLLGLTALERDPLADRAPATDGDALSAAAHAYARARHAANGRALKVAQAREQLDHAVDEFLATSRW